MSQRFKPRIYDFRRGQETTRLSRSDGPEAFQLMRNVLVNRVSAQRRGGSVRLGIVSYQGSIMDFDGTDDYVTAKFDARCHDFAAFPGWTVEFLAIADTQDVNVRTICAIKKSADHVFRIYTDSTSSGRVVATLFDNAGATTTLSVTGIGTGVRMEGQLKLTPAGVATLTVNGTTSTGTLGSGVLAAPDGDFTIGRTAATAATFFDGRIEFVRAFRGARTHTMDSRTRLLHSRAKSVLFDLVMEKSEAGSTDRIIDRGRFNRHGAVSGTPTTTSTFLSLNPMPIQSIVPTEYANGTRPVIVVAGGSVYPVTL